jgi:hypothetical protein
MAPPDRIHGMSALSGSTLAVQRAARLQQRPTQLIEGVVRSAAFTRAFAPYDTVGGITRMLEPSRRLRSVFERMEELDRELETADTLARRLAYLLGPVSFGFAAEMTERLIKEGSAVMVDLLGKILLTSDSLDLFEQAAKEGALRSDVRVDLLHAIEHLREEDFVRAAPSLATGVEGALRDAVPTGARRPANARGAAAKVVDRVELELLVGDIFNIANEVRHGEEADRETACILLLVCLLIWIEASITPSALGWLGRHLDLQLRQARELEAA